MRFFLSIYSAITLFSLTSCYIGPGGVCGPQTPIIYCSSKEDQDKLLNLKPYGAHWIKEGMTRESRRTDSWSCGAANTIYAADHVVFTDEQRNQVRLSSDKSDFEPDSRLIKQWQACMTNKGYSHLQHCDERCMYP
jgi:hypothetical protein